MIFLVSRRHVNVLSLIVLIPSAPVRPIPCLAALGVLGPFHGPVWTFQRETRSGLQGRRAADFVSNNAWCSWGILSPHLGLFHPTHRRLRCVHVLWSKRLEDETWALLDDC